MVSAPFVYRPISTTPFVYTCQLYSIHKILSCRTELQSRAIVAETNGSGSVNLYSAGKADGNGKGEGSGEYPLLSITKID